MHPSQIPGTEQTGLAREWRAFICLLRRATVCGLPSFLPKTRQPQPAAFTRVGKSLLLAVHHGLKMSPG